MNYKHMITKHETGKNLLVHERTFAIAFYFDVTQLAQSISWMALYRKAKDYKMDEEGAEQIYGIGRQLVEDIDKLRFQYDYDKKKWKLVQNTTQTTSDTYRIRLQRATVMRNLLERGMTIKEIAKRYNLSPQRVGKIIRWKNNQP